MAELATILGGTPVGILALLMLACLVVGSWYLSSLRTSFKYHTESDRAEFSEIRKAIEELSKKGSDRSEILFGEIKEIKENVASMRAEWAGLIGELRGRDNR